MSLPVPPGAPVSAVPIVIPASAPRPTGGWATQLTRLVRWELFLAWRRRGMVITLSALLLAGYTLVQIFMWLSWATLDQFIDQQQQVADQLLSFPLSVSVSGQYFDEVGTLLLIVLVGALIGSEYTYGTHRLSLARGVSRGQLLAAQVIALALLALFASGVMLLLGIVIGALGGMAVGGGEALSVAGLAELVVFWLAVALNAFSYALIALWIGTLARSVAGAIAGPLIYIFIELVATSLFSVFRYAPVPNAITQFISSIPDYLLGSNTNEVIQLSGQSPYTLLEHTGQLSLTHTLIVIAVYCGLFITSAYLLFRGRDVRE